MASDKGTKLYFPQGYLGDSCCCTGEKGKKEKRKNKVIRFQSFSKPTGVSTHPVWVTRACTCSSWWGEVDLQAWGTGRGGVAGGSYSAAHQ